MNRRATIMTGGAAVALLAIAGGLYAAAPWGNRAEAACPGSTAALARLRPLARGEVAGFEVAKAAAPATVVSFKAPDGGSRTLSSFRGRAVLLNLWATWCEPCKREMPALDEVQRQLGGPGFEVVAVNIDTRDLERPALWLKQAKIKHLAAYYDPEAKIFQDLRRAGVAEGLPTTLLIDPNGCRLGRLAGWAEWASPDGLRLIEAAISDRR